MADAKVGDGTQITNMPLTGKMYVDDSGVDKYVDFDDLTETGTFTPTLGDGTNDYTLSTATGNYTRIGKQVTAYINITWTDLGSAGGTILRVGGLPYAATSAAGFRAGTNLAYVDGLDNGAGKQITGWLAASVDYISFYLINDNAAPSSLLANSSNSTGILQLSVSYQAA